MRDGLRGPAGIGAEVREAVLSEVPPPVETSAPRVHGVVPVGDPGSGGLLASGGDAGSVVEGMDS